MNDAEFEKKLRALTGALRRPDPTPAWKADILARARREADAISTPRMLPPRWLMLTWAAAWVAILALNFTTPGETTLRTTPDLATAKPGPAPAAFGDSSTLLAFHRRLNLNLDLP
ncbi:MAG: hypothetical protein QOE70_3365 [Chthoniobacter sp.]|jgi:hypothetical protein|nr:hypothetical protein [Chthoniobacter sp.]